MNKLDTVILLTICILSIIPAIWAGAMMEDRGKSKGAGWAAGLFLSYLGPLIIALFVSKDYVEIERRKQQWHDSASDRIEQYRQKKTRKELLRAGNRARPQDWPREPEPMRRAK